MEEERLLRQQLVALLKGGFAPNITLLQEFDHQKAAIVLEGLHFSAWVLLGHIRSRQQVLLQFIKHPEEVDDVWPEAHWPKNYEPKSRGEWEEAIENYHDELKEMINLIEDPETSLFKVQPNGKTISWAAMANLHHTGYHIGQLKAIGRQLGVW